MASDRHPLMSESSDLSDTTSAAANNTPALPTLGFSPQSHSLGFSAFSPTSPPTSPRRPGYSRLLSDTTAVERNTPPTVLEEDEGDGERSGSSTASQQGNAGLGIAGPPTSLPARRVSVQTIPRVPVGIRSPSVNSPGLFSPPNTGDPFLGGFPQDSAASTPDLSRERFSPGDTPDVGGQGFRRGGRRNESDDYQAFMQSAGSDRSGIRSKGAQSIKSAYESEWTWQILIPSISFQQVIDDEC